VTFADGDALLIGVDTTDTEYASGDVVYYLIIVTIDNSSGAIVGDSTVNNVVFVVVVPANIDFAIDPFELGTSIGGGQITGASYPFINKTIAPVKIALNFEADLTGGGGDAALVDDPAALSPDDDTVTAKKLYFAALGAKEISDNTATTVTFDKEDVPETLAPFSAAGKTAAMSFVLKAGNGSAPASGTGGVAAFTFYGVLNSYADWQDGDVSVEAAYTLSALRPDTYTTLSDSAVGVNQIATAPGGGNVITADITLAATGTSGAPNSADIGKTVANTNGFTILLSAKPASISGVTRQNNTSANVTELTASQYTYDAASGVLAIAPGVTPSAASAATGTTLVIATASGTYYVVVSLV
jgi:hypothetical protein